MVTRKDIEAEAAFIQNLIDRSLKPCDPEDATHVTQSDGRIEPLVGSNRLIPCDVREATHVMRPDGMIEPIASKWGIDDPVWQGGPGVVTKHGTRLNMLESRVYYRWQSQSGEETS